ncbi:hypothetical protein [Streptomyces sp. H27-C3]|uniref:hypothetical protein n=1 Tax=Streptomyces sp. H27-C3 TaxID=3046305 RepID=UPI0024B9BCF8|nr:hypothetical protein [Streptomyces sp. H27-C3]MDJ0463121.1 hypothetical protein [Streptomyces sp. H27-C3]
MIAPAQAALIGLVATQYSAVFAGVDKRRHHPLFEQAVLASPQEAMHWLDERLARFDVDHPEPSERRALLRSLRGDLRRREEWLVGKARRPYAIATETHTVKLEGRLCPVRTLPLLASCLLLETS